MTSPTVALQPKTPSLEFPAQQSQPSVSISLDNVPFYIRGTSLEGRYHYYRAYLYPDKIVSVCQSVDNIPRTKRQMHTEANLTRGVYNGYMSKGTASRVRKFLTAWLKSAEHYKDVMKGEYEINEAYITFATVTLPGKQKHTDTEIKRKILVPFIEKLQRIYNVKHYFWKAEPQENGSIHFHLILDKYISNRWLQNEWNVSCNALDYLNEYFQETGSLFPPSSDIRKPKDMRNMIKYVLKYVTKTPLKIKSIKPGKDGRIVNNVMVAESNMKNNTGKYYIYRKIEGRVWGCSDGVRDSKIYSEDATVRVNRLIEIAEKVEGNRKFKDDYYEVVYCDTANLLRRYDSTLLLSYLEHYSNQFSALYEEEGPLEVSTEINGIKEKKQARAGPLITQSNLFENGVPECIIGN